MSNRQIETKPRGIRNSTGAGLVVMALGILMAVFTIGVVGLDIAHNTTSRTSLQNATDAAALAGAAAIVQNSINPINGFGGTNKWQSPYLQYDDSKISNGVENSVNTSAGNNFSDGHLLTHTSVNLSSPNPAVNFYIKNSFSQNDVPTNNGQCAVTATETINNLFAGIIGHPTDIVTTQSTASAYSTVTGVNANTLFPIAVSVDTIVGHGGGNSGNFPLNASQTTVSNPNAIDTASAVTFTMEDPCANAAWTTFNTLAAAGGPLIDGKTGADMDDAAVKYINKGLLPSVLGSAFSLFNPLQPKDSGPPAQFVGESSSTGGAAYTLNSGIDLWGALSGAGNGFTKAMEGTTLILPVVGGDQPFWNLDDTNNGTPYAPGARQTRPLIGFCAVKVTKVVWDSANNCLMGFKGYLVKGLVKGTPGIVDPLVDGTVNAQGVAKNAAIMGALANLSPGMVHLGSTAINASPSQIGNGAQVPLNAWYQGYVPPGNNTIQEATLDPGNEKIQPIATAFPPKMSQDMVNLCGGAQYNETVNWLSFQNPPFSASGVGMLKYNVNGDGALPTVYDIHDTSTPLPFAQLLLNPLSQKIKISATYSDEVGYNNQGNGKGYDIDGNTWAAAKSDDRTGPRYLVTDINGNVMQQPGYSSTLTDLASWPALKVGPDKGGGLGHTFDVSFEINPSSLNYGTGEYMVILHSFDTDLGHGGATPAYSGQAGAPGTPPGGINGSSLFYGDPAFYYLDIQFPQCPSL